jgi:hypothetical protein
MGHAAGDERLHQGPERALGAAEEGVVGHLAVLEHQLGGVGGAVAHLLQLAGHLEAGGVPVDDEHADALAALAAVGVGGDEAVVADGAVGDEVLAAVEDVAAVLLLGAGREAGGVGAGVRLGDRVGADDLPGDAARQVLLALRVGAELVDREGGEVGVGVHRGGDPGAHLRHLLDEDALGDLVGADAAVLLREHDAEQAELTEHREDLDGELLLALRLLDQREDLPLGELADHLAKVLLLLREGVAQHAAPSGRGGGFPSPPARRR